VVVRPDGYAFILNLTGEITSKIKIGDSRIKECAFCPSGEYLAIISEMSYSVVSLWDAKFNFKSELLARVGSRFNSISFCRGNDFIYVGDHEGNIYCFGIDGKKNWQTVCSPHVSINIIDSSPMIDKILVRDDNGQILVVENNGASVVGILDFNQVYDDEVFIGFNENASAILSLSGDFMAVHQYRDWKYWLSEVCGKLFDSSCQHASEEIETEYGRIACEICQRCAWKSEK
jgi:hypothetical protein